MNWRTLTGNRPTTHPHPTPPDRPPRPYNATSEDWRRQRAYSTDYETDSAWTLGELRVLGTLAELAAQPGVSPRDAAMEMFGG